MTNAPRSVTQAATGAPSTCPICWKEGAHVCHTTYPMTYKIQPAPDCRTCEWLPECSDGFRLNCFEGNQYKESKQIYLWRKK